jgi:spermidine synthase
VPLWFLGFTAFVCGATIMVVEILGARVIGPLFGVSLFVWTSLIAVTMIALAAGYGAGGYLVDRTESPDLLYAAIAAAGLLVLLVPSLKIPVLKISAPWGVRAGAFASALALFGPPLFLLGCVAPCVVRLAARRIEVVGKTVGCFYSLSTIGSVVGTVVTGFVLIDAFRVNQIFTLTGATLLAVAAVYIGGVRRRLFGAAAALAPVVLVGMLGQGTPLGTTRLLESGTRATLVDSYEGFYGNVRVIDYSQGRTRVREMTIDGLIQGGVDLGSGLPTYEYLYFMEFLPVAIRPGGQRCLVLGLGAGVLPRWYEARSILTDVVEINPDVVTAARQYFGFSGDGTVHLADARYHLSRPGPSYDYLVMDVFNGDATPAHLIGLEAFQAARARLTDAGVLAINLHGALAGRSQMTASVVHTLEQVFDNVDIYPTFDPAVRSSGNIALLAYDGEPVRVGPEALQGLPVHPLARQGVLGFARHRFTFPPSAAGLLLTDDHNPIDLLDNWLREEVRRNILSDTPWDLLIG